MGKLAMVVLVLGMNMMLIMVGSEAEASRLSLLDEKQIYDIILKDLELESFGKNCYEKCKSDADCCEGVSKCAKNKFTPWCQWCPGNGKTCGTLDPCCPGYDCIGTGFSGVCKPKGWCPKEGETCSNSIPCCSGYKCKGGIINGTCRKN